jgi:predicted nucleic acid-binding protein
MQDAYLLDTGVASIAWDGEHRAHHEIREKIAAFGEASISVCIVTIAEVLYGLEVSPHIDRQRHDAVKHALWQYKVWDIDRHTAQVYAPMRGRLFKQYAPRGRRGRLTTKWPEVLLESTSAKELGIQENDLWIVSVAIQYDLRFVTSEQKIKRILDVADETFGYDRALVWQIAQ